MATNAHTVENIFDRARQTSRSAKPNRFTNEYCFGLPGVLPVLNRTAVEMAIRAGLALGCTIRERSTWSRKHYFYPDLPKAIRSLSTISRSASTAAEIAVTTDAARINIRASIWRKTRARCMHVEGATHSLVDFNRAGLPLIEIVTEPDLRSAHEASAYLKALRRS